MNSMNIRNEMAKINKMSLMITQGFLFVSIIALITGIFVVKAFNDVENARYLLILGGVVLCEGVWGGVIIDCIHRRRGKG